MNLGRERYVKHMYSAVNSSPDTSAIQAYYNSYGITTTLEEQR